MPSSPSPSPADIVAARAAVQALLSLRVTAAQDWCCSQLYTSRRTWQQWEANERAMHPAFWDLFQRKFAEAKAHAKPPAEQKSEFR